MCHFFKVEIKTGALKNAIKKKGLERPKQEDQDTKRRIFLLFPPNACMHVQSLSHVRLFVTPWTIACKAPLTMGFSRQEYWSGLPCPPPCLSNLVLIFFLKSYLFDCTESSLLRIDFL